MCVSHSLADAYRDDASPAVLRDESGSICRGRPARRKPPRRGDDIARSMCLEGAYEVSRSRSNEFETGCRHLFFGGVGWPWQLSNHERPLVAVSLRPPPSRSRNIWGAMRMATLWGGPASRVPALDRYLLHRYRLCRSGFLTSTSDLSRTRSARLALGFLADFAECLLGADGAIVVRPQTERRDAFVVVMGTVWSCCWPTTGARRKIPHYGSRRAHNGIGRIHKMDAGDSAGVVALLVSGRRRAGPLLGVLMAAEIFWHVADGFWAGPPPEQGR